jgi:peroxiredoxin
VLSRLPLLIILASAACAGPHHPPAVEASVVGKTVSDVPLQTLDGRATTLSEALGGHIGLVSMWATWCETCREELAALTRLSERAGARGAVVLAVAVGEKRETVQAFVAAHHLGYTQLVDEDFHLADALGARRVPTTLVIDRAGRIGYLGGALDEETLAALRRTLDAPVANAR